jgi:hypothetical protein
MSVILSKSNHDIQPCLLGIRANRTSVYIQEKSPHSINISYSIKPFEKFMNRIHKKKNTARDPILKNVRIRNIERRKTT